jgi:pimeloyl-ACP methyl ester carboxylesterase
VPHIETAHGTLFYARRGSGAPVLVCLHGAGGTHQHWGAQLQSLSDIVQVLAPGLPGHGRTPGAGRTSIADYSAVVLAFLAALELDRVVLAGHSMGGAIALQIALTAPERVAGLVLASTGARLPVNPAFLEGLMNEPTATVKAIVKHVYSPGVSDDVLTDGETEFSQVAPEVFSQDLLACNTFDVRERLGEIACPTLVLCGQDDRMAPPKLSHLLHEQIHSAELALIPDAGHMVQVEQPAAVSSALRDWLTSQYKND